MKRKYDPELIKDDIKELIRQTLKEALESELEEFLGYSKYERVDSDNSRNGYISKTVKTAVGEVEIETPRDRKGEFEPKIVKKRQTVLGDLENKVIALYSKGMTVRDIQELLSDMYGMDISHSLISKITDRLTPKIEEWQSRPLERTYVILYIDCIFYKVRQDGKVIDKAVYVIIGINREGRKELLGFWINKTESASFWFKVFNDLKSRGVEDVLIFSVDNLSGIGKAIKGVYPQAEVQKCVVHQIRNSLRYVSWKDKKELSSDLKKVYGAATLEEAELRMDEFEEKWENKYPHVIKSWRTNWEELMTYFKYPFELRKLMYTTNTIESVNSKFRKVTDGKRVFPGDASVLKSLYLVALELERKWRKSVIKDWGIIYGQLSVIFNERLEV